MNEELKFIDFAMQYLYKIYPNHKSINKIADLYKKEYLINFEYAELKRIVDDCEYLVKESPTYLVSLSLEGKRIIKDYDSLSEYLKISMTFKNKETRKANAIKIWPIILSALMFIAVVIFGIIDISQNIEIKELKKEIITKDSIINVFKFQIDKIDSLKTE